MGVITKCAEYLDESLVNIGQMISTGSSMADVHEKCVNGTNSKSYIFNACTIAMIACAVLGVTGIISTASAAILGALSYFGRRVADESFGIMIPSIIKYFASNFLRPKPLWSLGEIVILYDTLPNNKPFG